jgi:2-polyprenyl-3-methyl-5-hydroxy-6-metoxy-1,4-benzoquinol methylase
MDTKDHYDKYLHAYYSWIYGGLKNKIEENKKFFLKNFIKPQSTGIAIDLGAGTGFQSIALAELGFSVKSVDFSVKLLKELNTVKHDLDIHTIESDIMNFNAYAGYNPELVICMGDTLTHLQNLKSVEELILNSFKILNKKGKIILSFRDLTPELKDDKRFIPVRSDENIIFTCFVECYPDYVKVYDIVHEKTGGAWNQKISFYKKIKISEQTIKKIISMTGLTIQYLKNENGIITMIGEKL